MNHSDRDPQGKMLAGEWHRGFPLVLSSWVLRVKYNMGVDWPGCCHLLL